MTEERIHNAKDTPSQTSWSAMPEPTQTCRSKTCPSSLSMTCTTFLCLLSCPKGKRLNLFAPVVAARTAHSRMRDNLNRCLSLTFHLLM